MVFEPTCAHARWALRRCLVSVRMSVSLSVFLSVRDNPGRQEVRTSLTLQIAVCRLLPLHSNACHMCKSQGANLKLHVWYRFEGL